MCALRRLDAVTPASNSGQLKALRWVDRDEFVTESLERLGATLANVAAILTLVLAIMSMRRDDEQARRMESLERREVQLAEQELAIERERLAEERATERARTGCLTDADMERFAEEIARRVADERGRP